MFAYCNNDPVNCVDSEGTRVCLNNKLMSNDGGGTYSTNGNVPAKIKQPSVNSTGEQMVIDGGPISVYNGRIVIKTKLMNGSGFSFGIILVGNDVDEDLLRHEYGHTVQLEQIGWWNYLVKGVLPSVKGYWSGVPYNDYYSQPFEYVAELLGQVERDNYVYSDTAYQDAIDYWGDMIVFPVSEVVP